MALEIHWLFQLVSKFTRKFLINPYVLYKNQFPFLLFRRWVPGCGENLILPKLEHQDYYEDISIFTKFRELNCMQIIGVFRFILDFLKIY